MYLCNHATRQRDHRTKRQTRHERCITKRGKHRPFSCTAGRTVEAMSGSRYSFAWISGNAITTRFWPVEGMANVALFTGESARPASDAVSL